ncbi:MAG: universal stress protein [Nitrospirota bacterium]|nr:universal stress protein [Nitrospirota bacterium]
MMKKILAAVDGSDHAWKALNLAADMAKLHGAELVILHVVPYEDVPEALRQFAEVEHVPLEEERARYQYAKALSDGLTRQAEAWVRSNGLTAVSAHAAEGKAADVILEFAKNEAADTIVLGSRGVGYVSGMLLGSVSHKVANLADVTCVVVK